MMEGFLILIDHFYGLIFWLARKYGCDVQFGVNPNLVRDRLLHCTQSWIFTPSSWEVQGVKVVKGF
jgi:hypothetical protein